MAKNAKPGPGAFSVSRCTPHRSAHQNRTVASFFTKRLGCFLAAKRTGLCERTLLKVYGSSLACCCLSQKTKKLKQNRTTVATSSADRKLKAFASWFGTRTQCRPFARAQEKQNGEACETESDFLEALRNRNKRDGVVVVAAENRCLEVRC